VPRCWHNWQRNVAAPWAVRMWLRSILVTPEDSRAQVNTERDIEFALGEHEIAHLAAIDAALERIAAGSYGECTDCGADIGTARLHVAPEAARCLGCQEKAEK
jgi:DnaK suppressor protein